MKRLAVIFVTAICFSSCQKNITTTDKQTSLQTTKPDYLPGPCPYDCHDTRCKAYANGYCGPIVPDTIAITKNPNNPYDYVGGQHNNGVRNILPTVNFSSSNLDSVVLSKVKAYSVTLGYNADSVQHFYNSAVVQGYLPYSSIPELDSLSAKLYANGKLSSYGNSYMQQIYGYLNTYLNTDSITAARCASFSSSLISVEAAIKNDSRISTYEKQVLESASAIGRYSASYWGNNLLISAALVSSGTQSFSTQPFFLQKLKRWMRIAACDIGGALIGVIGGPWGIIGGGVGSSIIADASI